MWNCLEKLVRERAELPSPLGRESDKFITYHVDTVAVYQLVEAGVLQQMPAILQSLGSSNLAHTIAIVANATMPEGLPLLSSTEREELLKARVTAAERLQVEDQPFFPFFPPPQHARWGGDAPRQYHPHPLMQAFLHLADQGRQNGNGTVAISFFSPLRPFLELADVPAHLAADVASCIAATLRAFPDDRIVQVS